MTVSISGSTGIQLPLGSAASPAETNTTAQATGIYYPSSTTLGLSTNGTNAVYIDASQNVGIGTTSPTTKLTINDPGNGLTFNNAASGNFNIGLLNGTSSVFAYIYQRANGPLIFGTNNTEVVRFDNSGNVGIGTSSISPIGAGYTAISISGGNGGNLQLGSASLKGQLWFNTDLYIDSATGAQIFRTNSTERMRIDSSGNVGIGTSSPAAQLEVVGNVSFKASGSSNTLYFRDSSGNYVADITSQGGTSFQIETRTVSSSTIPMTFGIGSSEKMRLDTSGNLLLGTTSALSSSNTFAASGANYILALNSTSSSGSIYTDLGFFNQGTLKSQIYWQLSNGNFYVTNGTGGVYLAANATAWSSNSDERLKNITGEIKNGLSKICSLRAAEFTWKTDTASKPQVGLIAQDVQKVLPESITTSSVKDDPSETEYLSVVYTDVIPLLVAAIQELSAELTALKAKVGA